MALLWAPNQGAKVGAEARAKARAKTRAKGEGKGGVDLEEGTTLRNHQPKGRSLMQMLTQPLHQHKKLQKPQQLQL